jgi:hypothetical protein
MIFSDRQELRLFACSPFQAGREDYRDMLGQQPTLEIPEVTQGLPEHYYENM